MMVQKIDSGLEVGLKYLEKNQLVKMVCNIKILGVPDRYENTGFINMWVEQNT